MLNEEASISGAELFKKFPLKTKLKNSVFVAIDYTVFRKFEINSIFENIICWEKKKNKLKVSVAVAVAVAVAVGTQMVKLRSFKG